MIPRSEIIVRFRAGEPIGDLVARAGVTKQRIYQVATAADKAARRKVFADTAAAAERPAPLPPPDPACDRLVAAIQRHLAAHPRAWHELADAYDAAEEWLRRGVPVAQAERRIAAGRWTSWAS